MVRAIDRLICYRIEANTANKIRLCVSYQLTIVSNKLIYKDDYYLLDETVRESTKRLMRNAQSVNITAQVNRIINELKWMDED